MSSCGGITSYLPFLIPIAILLIIFGVDIFDLNALTSGPEPVKRCATSCGDVRGQLLPSCRGCDWFLNCDDVTRQEHCPLGQLFDVSKGECRAQKEATCGLDSQNKSLAPSSAFIGGQNMQQKLLGGLLKNFFSG